MTTDVSVSALNTVYPNDCNHDSGMLYVGVRDYQSAYHLFLHGITSPTYTGNAITLSMFKKFIIIALITSQNKYNMYNNIMSDVNGNNYAIQLPKYTPAIVQREIKGKLILILNNFRHLKEGRFMLIVVRNTHLQVIIALQPSYVSSCPTYTVLNVLRR